MYKKDISSLTFYIFLSTYETFIMCSSFFLFFKLALNIYAQYISLFSQGEGVHAG